MKYRCSHCNHTFELEERAFHRCPNCFWTTSLVPIGGEAQEVSSSNIVSPPAEKPKTADPFPKKVIIFLVVLGAIGGLTFVLFKTGVSFPKFSLRLPAFPVFNHTQETSKTESVKSSLKEQPPQTAISLLNPEERAQLVQSFQITIPRKLSEDEEEILKKQVSFPAKLAEKPKITVWEKQDFEKMLESEQTKRKIMLGWLYVRSLTKTFEKYYPTAVQAFDKDDYVSARELFIKSLAFPVYQNNPKLHRAVALVMLRSYINDVIGKIAILNQYLLTQNLLTEVHGIFESHQALFPVLELQEWDHALQRISELKKRIAAFENRPEDVQADYPPALAQVDAEIQAAIKAEATPKPEAAVSLKALLVDIDLKEKAVRQNTAEGLLKAQKQYEEALEVLKQGNWQAAREVLVGIDYPSELAEEAKKKLVLIDKIFALQETKASNQKK